jgi:multiple sugar transport system substrate-binding protein
MEIKPSRTTFRVRLDAMVMQLRENIISGKLPIGSYLPSEEDLGEEFQLSKKSVRKGLEILVEENLIVKKAKIGNMVSLPDAAKDKISIRFGYYPGSDEEAGLTALLDAFERKYSHIHVKRMTMHFRNYEDYEFMNDNALDVIMLNYNHYRIFHKRDALHLLSEQSVDERIYPFLNKAFTHDGKLYARPFLFSPVVLCYNKKHFQQANLQEPDSSWTWQDFCQAAAKLTNTSPMNKRLGFYFHLLSLNRWPLFLLQNGFALQKDAEEQYSLNNDSFMESMIMIKELFSQQKIIPSFMSQSDVDTERLFFDEKASMIITTYFNLNNIKNVPFEYDISPVPYIHYPQTLLLNIGLAINRQSPHKEAAQLLVDFLTSQETFEAVRRNTLSLPSMKEAAEKVLKKSNGPSRFQMFKEIIPSYRYYTDMNVETEHLAAMLHHLKLYWSEMVHASDIISDIEQELNKQ